jgi:hypothetical protein
VVDRVAPDALCRPRSVVVTEAIGRQAERGFRRSVPIACSEPVERPEGRTPASDSGVEACVDAIVGYGDPWLVKDGTISIGSFEDEPDDLAYWRQQPAEDRLAAIEHLRRQFFDYGEARQEFRRLLEVTELPRG